MALRNFVFIHILISYVSYGKYISVISANINELLVFISDTSCVLHEVEIVLLNINGTNDSLRKGTEEGLPWC